MASVRHSIEPPVTLPIARPNPRSGAPFAERCVSTWTDRAGAYTDGGSRRRLGPGGFVRLVVLSLFLSACVVRAGRPHRHRWFWHRRAEITNPVAGDLTMPPSVTAPAPLP